jgi:hypothetical protein
MTIVVPIAVKPQGFYGVEKDLPPGKLRINSPYDSEARYSVKGQTT